MRFKSMLGREGTIGAKRIGLDLEKLTLPEFNAALYGGLGGGALGGGLGGLAGGGLGGWLGS
jgi:hypothetical protein